MVLQLNAICRAATLDFALAVGKLIIEKVYAGDLDRWRDRNPKKDLSLRRIATHHDLPMSPAALYRSIAIFEICERLGVRSWKHVSTTHIRLVLPLPPEEQARLIRDTETNRWPARRLDQEVANLVRLGRFPCAKRGGRKRASGLESKTRRFEKLLRALGEILACDDDAVVGPFETARAAIELLRRVSRDCAVLEGRLERQLVQATC